MSFTVYWECHIVCYSIHNWFSSHTIKNILEILNENGFYKLLCKQQLCKDFSMLRWDPEKPVFDGFFHFVFQEKCSWKSASIAFDKLGTGNLSSMLLYSGFNIF